MVFKIPINAVLKDSELKFYSPSPEYPVACWSEAEIPLQRGYRDEWQGVRAEALQSEGGLASANSALIPRPASAGLRGASLK